MKFNVYEIYKTIQGESSYAGLLCVMARFAGCNLNCSYCDTKEARSTEKSIVLTADEIIKKISGYNCNLVELTGGEPLLQKNISYLIDKLIGLGFTVIIETNGSQPIKKYSEKAIFIVDVKCPSSGESKKFLYANLDHIKSK
ncbi:radical SAM protein, partial [bacterium]|nr:radical SAM protein [bacterium]